MAGFNINSTGGPIANTAETLRQHRWRILKLGPEKLDNTVVIAESIDLPTYTIEEQPIQAGLLTYKFAKGVIWEDITINLYDTKNLYSHIIKWRDKIYTNESGIQSPNSYKDITEFELLGGDDAAVINYGLHNSWPKSISHSTLSYASSDIKLLTITLSYDFAVIK